MMNTQNQERTEIIVPDASIYRMVHRVRQMDRREYDRRWRENQPGRVMKLIKCIIVGLVAGYAMSTDQAAMWLTLPALGWSLSYGAVLIDRWLDGGCR